MSIRFGKRSLRAVLVIPFVMLSALSVGLVGFVSFHNGRQAVNDVAAQLQSEAASRIRDQLRSFLSLPRQIVRVNADAISRDLPAAGDVKELERSFREQVRIFETVTSIYFGNTSGGLVDSGRDPVTDERYVMNTKSFARGLLEKYGIDSQGNRTTLLASVRDFDARARPWYLHAVEKGDVVWSPIYILSTGQDMAIACSHPVYDTGGTLLGVVSVDVFLSHISRFLQSLKIGDRGQCFIFERSGLLIASSSDRILFTEASGPECYRRIHADESISPVVRSAVDALNVRFGGYHGISTTQQVPLVVDGQGYSVAVSSFFDAGSPDWLIGVVVREADFMSQVEANNRDTVLLITAALLITIIIGLLAARRITQPMLRMHVSALSLARGEWPPPIDMDSSITEVDEVAKSFDHMAAQLRETLESLSHEVDERTRTEAALRVSEEHYRVLFDSIRDAAFVHLIDIQGRPGRFMMVNEEACNRLGYSAEELLSMTPLDIGAPETADMHASIADELNTKGFALFEIVHVAKDGRRINVESNVRRLTMGDHDVILSISRDVTQRKQAERALRESEERWQFALEGNGDGVWDWNLQTNEVYFSKQWKAILGFDEHEICNRLDEWDQLVHPDDRDTVWDAIRNHLEGRSPAYISEHRLRCKDGTYKWILDRGKVIRWDQEGKPLRTIGTHTDITGRRHAEEVRLLMEQRLQQMQKVESLGRMAGAIAHNFNNMLGSVIGNLEFVLEDLPRESQSWKDVAEAAKASWRTSEISRFMLTYLGQTGGKKEPIDLAESLEEARSLLMASIPGNVRLRTHLPAHGPMIEADRAHIKQILSNLVSNAVEAIGEAEGRITVAAELVAAEKICRSNLYPMDWKPVEKNYACLSVADTGSGLEAATLERVFDPFFTTRFTGRGLGLPVVLGLMRSYEGAITVESKPGEGAVFRIHFPVSEREESLPPEKVSFPPSVQGEGVILVVDDEPMIRNVAGAMLERLGYDVIAASDGLEAVELFKLRKDEIGIVILDLSVPGMDGWETLRALRALRSDIPVILSSGYEEARMRQEDSVEQPQALLNKPYKKEDLKHALATCRTRRVGN